MTTNLKAVLESMMRGIHAELTKDIRSHRPSYEGLGLVEKTELRTIALKQLEGAGFFKKCECKK